MTTAYSGFLEGWRADNQDYQREQELEMRRQESELRKQMTALQIDSTKNQLAEYDANAGVRALEREAKTGQTQDTIDKLRTFDEIEKLVQTVPMADEQGKPRDQLSIATDLFRKSQTSADPAVKQHAMDIYRKAGAEQAAQEAVANPVAAFKRLQDLNLVLPGYSARSAGKVFEIVGPDGKVTNQFPLEAAGLVVRDFAQGESVAITELLKDSLGIKKEERKASADMALEKYRQGSMTGRERMQQNAMTDREKVQQAAYTERTAITQGAATARTNATQAANVKVQKIRTGERLLGLLMKNEAGGQADAGEFDAEAVADIAAGRTPPADTAASAQPATAVPGTPANAVGADTRERIKQALPTMDAATARAVMGQVGLSGLGVELYARLAAKARGAQ